MVKKAFVPEKGDIVWLDFDPTKGHEQAGKRPALVLSHRAYNEKSGLALVCPITSKAKGYPFEVSVASGSVQGVALADHVRSVDWKVRNAESAGRASAAELDEAIVKLAVLYR